MLSRALAVLVLATASATAAPSQDLQAGIDAFRLGKYADARAHLDKAAEADPKAGAPHRYLAAVAHAERKWDDCVASARRALILEPADADAADTRKLHEECRAAAGRTPYRGGELGESAAISVTANVAGATVRVGGLVYGGTPVAPRPIPVGKLAIEVDKSGYKRVKLAVDTVRGIVTDVDVELEPNPDAAPLPYQPRTGTLVLPPRTGDLMIDGRPLSIPADGRLELPPGVHLVELNAPGKDPWRRRVAITAEHSVAPNPVLVDSGPRERGERLGVIVASGGAALIALGLGAFYVSRDAANDARDIVRIETMRLPGQTSPPIRTRADFDAARDKANTWGIVSDLAYVAGFAAGGIGAYLWYRHRAPSDDSPDFAIAPITGGAVFARTSRW